MQFIKIMIYFNKLIGICINRQESQKVVDNYFVGTIKKIAKAIFLCTLNGGTRKGTCQVQAGSRPD